jgi:alkanesulfonate monooxygenase SsuD/methylene tetrahydromethanopterin reductase-like flavin-dependent oxidoreductase (luciferase family)
MFYGLEIPHFGPYADPRILAELAEEAEAAGWDGFFLWDHMTFGPDPLPMTDPWVALTAIAMRTERMKIGAMITPLPRRRPWKVARETVALDHLSNGRLVFGVGIGVLPAEFDQLGEEGDQKERGAMLDEALDVLAGLWSGELFNHQGAHYHVQDARFLPAPLQRPRIPVWVAGSWPNKAPFRRAARWDGAFPQGRGLQLNEQMTPESIAEVRDFIREQRASDAPYDILHIGMTDGLDAEADRAFAQRYAEAGVTWWVENITPNRWRSWEGFWPLVPGSGDDWPLDEMRARICNGPPR